MFIVDTNVLLAAVNRTDPRHQASVGWLDGALSEGTTVGFPWSSLLGFIRLATTPGVVPDPISSDSAIGIARSWLSVPNSITPEPTPRHLDLVAGFLDQAGKAAALVPDAHLAALAIEYGGTVVSFGTDFSLWSVPWLRPRAA